MISRTLARTTARTMAQHSWQSLLFASLALAALPGPVAAADPNLDQTVRDLELRQEREQARRDMAARERAQSEALRGQEESIRRLEQARQRLESSTREVAELSTQLGRNYSFLAPSITVLGQPPRALLGINVSNERRQDGALVSDVSPGGPAAEAGIRPGDLIVSLDGTDLTTRPDAASALVELMQQVEPERRVHVGLLRDGNRIDLDVTARAGPAVQARSGQLRMRSGSAPQVQRFLEPMLAPPALDVAGGLRLDGMEFATVSSRLGRYFGVVSGVLVVRAGNGAPFELQDGDVILTIDGRAPTTAQHAGRILRSYQPGEKVKLRVQRDRKAIDIDTTAPGN